VKQDLIQRHCNAYTLDDVRKQLELRGLRVGDIEIRARGIDEAAVVLLVGELLKSVKIGGANAI
jgi:hypothetical protein